MSMEKRLKQKTRIITFAIVLGALFISGCNNTNDSKNEPFDYGELGVSEYKYPEEFAIGDNLRAMLENCAIYYTDYDNSNEIDAEWEQGFIHNFCQNSWFGYDYLNSIGDNGGLTISKEQVEYIYNSFSGNSAEFMSLTEGEDIKIDEASSGFSYAELLDYKTEDNGDEINLSVTFKISNAVDGDIEKEGKVTLIKNPYSCFDGYSVKNFHIS
ncbi:hypothetical protein D6853_00010 [Butyrivibrio sp. X503]|nr:hypothetical protein D6853_00010 [Butyrivibrio sp. X503]